MRISVIGSGGWGTALAIMLANNGHDVALWSFLQEEYEALSRDRENKAFLSGVPFPENLETTADMECVRSSELVVMAVPSFAVRETAKKLSAYLDGQIVVNVAKGIEKGSAKRLSEVIEDEIGTKGTVVVLSGPSHAEEVGRGVPTAIVAASKIKEAAETVQDVFMNDRFRVYITADVVGVELGAALKNIMALAAGICDGLKLGDNTKAALMTRGLAETARLGTELGGREETFLGLAGVGDLIVTCTSMHSRNRRAGIMIGEGLPINEVLEKVGGVVEGYYATQAGMYLASRAGVEMPITEEMHKILFENASPREAMNKLMMREKKSESRGAWDR